MGCVLLVLVVGFTSGTPRGFVACDQKNFIENCVWMVSFQNKNLSLAIQYLIGKVFHSLSLVLVYFISLRLNLIF